MRPGPTLRKKRKPKPTNPVHAAAEANETKVAAAFVGSLSVLRAGVNQDRLLVALQRNDIGTAIDSFPWDVWSATLGRLLLPRLTEVMRQAGEGVGRQTVVKKDFTLRGIFDIKNPRAIRIAAEIAARLVTRVTDATKWAMRQVIADGQRNGISVRDQAEQIKTILIEQAGLDGPRARRLEAFRASQTATGAQPQVVAARVAQQRDRLLWERARTISVHETQAAATAGQAEVWEQAVETGLLPTTQVYEWLTADEGGGRVCPICLPMNGQRVRRGQLFKSPEDGSTHAGPPAHVMCLPGDTLVLPRGRVTAASKRWIEDDLVVIQVADALPLSCTPNHPILTRSGWVPARLLDVGDEVAHPGFRNGRRAADGQDVDTPVRIEEIAEPLLVGIAPQPVTAEDFHGDGKASEVAVVWTDRLLGDTLDAGRFEESPDDTLVGADVGLAALPRLGDLGLYADVAAAPARRVVGSADLGHTLGSSHHRPLKGFGLGLGTDVDAGLSQAAPDDAPTHAEVFGDRILGLTADVHADDIAYRQIVSKAHRRFSGFVYNIETTTGYYLAAGYAIHNCRCTLVLVDPFEDEK